MLRNVNAQEIIKNLERDKFYAICPCCGENIKLKDASLFFMDHFTPEAEKLYDERIAQLREEAKGLREKRKQISKRSESGAKAINIGFILERLAPSLKAFRFNTNDCRSLFDPIDYVIFEGLSSKGKVDRIVFTDIKTGSAKLNEHQKDIKSVVEKKRLVWDTYQQEVKT
jgi:predicted Holliday junction resolvase-like endonuclease